MTATGTSTVDSPSAALLHRTVLEVPEHTLEIVSDSGEGAQKCGQVFGAVSAKMGNGVCDAEREFIVIDRSHSVCSVCGGVAETTVGLNSN